MDSLLIKELPIKLPFDYEILFSSTKSSATDLRLKSLLKDGIKKQEIKIKKYLIANDVENELIELGEWKVKTHKKIKPLLKDWHLEGDESLIPLLFVLEKLEPGFEVVPDPEINLRSIKSYKNIEIGKPFTEEDAFARLFLPDEKVIVNLTSDSLRNTINCLMIENIKTYLVNIEWIKGEPIRLVAYELISTENFKRVKKELDDNVRNEIFK